MVESLTPNYYAAGERSDVLIVRGYGFGQLRDAIAVTAYHNYNPLQYLNSDDPRMLYDFYYVSPTEARLVSQSGVTSHSDPYFIGAFVSRDRQTVYWVNESNPLPT